MWYWIRGGINKFPIQACKTGISRLVSFAEITLTGTTDFALAISALRHSDKHTYYNHFFIQQI